MKFKEHKEQLGNYFDSCKFVFGFLNGYKFRFVAFYLGWLFDAVLSVLTPIVFGVLINEIVYYQNFKSFMQVSGVFVFLVLFICLLYYFIYFIYSELWNSYNLSIRRKAFQVEQNAKASYMVNSNTGDMISMIEWQTSETMNFLVRNVIHIFNAILTVIACIVIIYNINWQIGVVMTAFVPISALVTIKFGQKMKNEAWNNKQFYAGYISWLTELIMGIREIRLLGAQKYVDKKFIKNYKGVIKTDINCGLSSLTASNIISVVNIVLQTFIYGVIAYLSFDSKISIGTIVTVLTFYNLMVTKIKSISNFYMDSMWRGATIRRVNDFLNIPQEDLRSNCPPISITDGVIDIKNITFGYTEKKILNDFSLHINSGERIAIVGESGCGKSTLINLILNFYNSEKGSIFVDGQDLSKYSLQSIRENIGVVQQDIYIIDGTIRENILLGRLDATDSEIEEACKNAEIYDFIDSLENGLDTKLGVNGRQISGGQRQRIAIARIYLKNPQIIIFDEATSALDTKTEEQIHEAWKKMLSGRTSIVIAHRLSSVMLCNRVSLIKNGIITVSGTPQELYYNNADFRKLFAIGEEAAVV